MRRALISVVIRTDTNSPQNGAGPDGVRRRYHAAMLWVLLLLVVAALVELYVIIQVADVIGGWQTIAVLVAESMIGAWLVKRQGLSVLARVSEAVEAGRVPSRELVDGFLILLAGALMLPPGSSPT